VRQRRARRGATPTRGLVALADRLHALGGTLAVESPAGAGTRLVARLPAVP
jgi:signal transduction histidine kinase